MVIWASLPPTFSEETVHINFLFSLNNNFMAMKRILLLMGIVFFGMTAMAQKDSKSISLNLAYGTEVKNVGVGLKGAYFITDEVRAELGFNRFLNKSNTNMWDINANLHYVFNLSEKVAFYPILGFTLTNWGAAREVTDNVTNKTEKIWSYSSRLGANFGLGAQYNISDRVFSLLEVKKQVVSDYDQTVVSLGIGMRF